MSVRNQSINLPVLNGTPLAANSSTDEILFNTHSGSNGSTNTSVPIFTTVPTSTTTYTVASTAAAGSSARIDKAGIYLVVANYALDETTGAQTSSCAITLDSTDLAGAFTATDSFVRSYGEVAGDAAADDDFAQLSAVVVISRSMAAASDEGYVRSQMFPITDVALGDALVSLRITRIGNFDA